MHGIGPLGKERRVDLGWKRLLEAARAGRSGRPRATGTHSIAHPAEKWNGVRAFSLQGILVSLGANLSGPGGVSPLMTCRQAAAALDGLPGLHLRGLSRWFITAPVVRAG